MVIDSPFQKLRQILPKYQDVAGQATYPPSPPHQDEELELGLA